MLIWRHVARRRHARLRVAGHHHLAVGRRHDVVGAQDRRAVRIAKKEQKKRHENQRDNRPQAMAEQAPDPSATRAATPIKG